MTGTATLLQYAAHRSPDLVCFVLSHAAVANAVGAGCRVPDAILPSVLGWYGFSVLRQHADQPPETRPSGTGELLAMVAERAGFNHSFHNDLVRQRLEELLFQDPEFLPAMLGPLQAKALTAVTSALQNIGWPVPSSIEVPGKPLQVDEAQIDTGCREILQRLVEEGEAERRNNPGELANFYDEIGSLMEDLGDFQTAQTAYERVIALRKQAPNATSDELADALFNLGAMMLANQAYGPAAETLAESLSLYQILLDRDDPRLAPILGALGDAMHGLEDPIGARENYEKALVIIEKVLEENHPFVRDLWVKLAALGKAGVEERI